MDPATMMMMVAAVGEMMAGIGSYFTSRQQGEALDAAAKQARTEGSQAAQLELENTDRTTARAATLAAASGGGLTGSALTVLDDLSRQGVYNARAQIYQGESEGRNLNYQAKVTRRQGELELFLSMHGAAGKVASSFAGKALEARKAKLLDLKASTIDKGQVRVSARTQPTPFVGEW